jgi:hypothetical protein
MAPEIKNFNGFTQTLILIRVLSSIKLATKHPIAKIKWAITIQYNIGLCFFTVLNTCFKYIKIVFIQKF